MSRFLTDAIALALNCFPRIVLAEHLFGEPFIDFRAIFNEIRSMVHIN